MDDLIRESVVKILEILSSVGPVRQAIAEDHTDSIGAQYVIDEDEIKDCERLLERFKAA